MRASCLLFLSVCLAKLLSAQTFNASPGPLLQQEIQFNQANECYIYFDNPSGDSLQLHWRLVESNLPDAWDADLCDYGLCYIGIPSNGLMSTVYDTIRPYLKLILQPGDAPGATWIWFRVYEEGNQDNFVDVFFSLYTPGTLGADSPLESTLVAYPNPASQYLFLENNQSARVIFRVSNVQGQLVWQGSVSAFSQEKVEVGDWPDGFYFLQNGSRIQKIVVQK